MLAAIFRTCFQSDSAQPWCARNWLWCHIGNKRSWSTHAVSSKPLTVAAEVATFVAGLVMTIGNPIGGSVVKVLSLPVSGARAISGYDPEMISGAGSQPTDVRTNTLGRVPGFSLGGSRQSVAGRCSILKIHAGGQSVGSNRAVQVGCKVCDEGCWNRRWPDRRPSYWLWRRYRDLKREVLVRSGSPRPYVGARCYA